MGRHNGAIAVSSVEGEGTTFSAWFPEYRGDMPPTITEAEMQGGGETILLALLLMGERPPAETHPLALNAVLTALMRVGLALEARALAIEAALGNGI